MFTRAHPDLRIEIRGSATLSAKHVVMEAAIFGPGENGTDTDWTQEIAEIPDVLKVDRIDVLPGLNCYRVVTHIPSFIRIAKEHGLLLRYPRIVERGAMTCETIAHRSQLQGFVTALRGMGQKARILSLRGDALRTASLTLTATQRNIFQQALAAGYFEVPRRITLTQLAHKLGRSKSSVSVELAIVERKLAENASRLAL